jgi:hypothetical protein
MAQPAGEASRDRGEPWVLVVCTYAGTGATAPDFLAQLETRPTADASGRVVATLPLPYRGDEAHAATPLRPVEGGRREDRVVVAGLRTSRLYVVAVAPGLRPELLRVIEPEAVRRASGHTHPIALGHLPDGLVLAAMLGDREGWPAGGFAVLDPDDGTVLGRWEEGPGPRFGGPFWCDGARGLLLATGWGHPEGVVRGPEDAQAGRSLNVWDLAGRRLVAEVDLGPAGTWPAALAGLPGTAGDAAAGLVASAGTGAILRWSGGPSEAWSAEPVRTERADPAPRGLSDLVVVAGTQVLAAGWRDRRMWAYAYEDGRLVPAAPPPWSAQEGTPGRLTLTAAGQHLYVGNSYASGWDAADAPGLLVRLSRTDDGSWRRDWAARFEGPEGPARPRAVVPAPAEGAS